ncbi:MAG: DUF4097 family beta strand repeat-containing protein [Phycisphaerales bacterium]
MKTMLLIRLAAVVIATGVLAAGCQFGGDTFKAKFVRSEELTASLDGITAVDVNIEVGKIQLEAADAAETHIQAEIQVRAATEEKAEELAQGVRITAEPSGHTLVIKAVKPSGFGRNELSVDLTITAPAGLALKCTTNVGDIRTVGFTNSVKACTSVGAIACTGLRGDVDLHTNVGDIRAEYASDAPAAIEVDASANVGAIELAGPQETSASLTAEANVGSIDTDRPLTVTGHLKQSIRASLGSAEGRISLRTNVGSIRIR